MSRDIIVGVVTHFDPDGYLDAIEALEIVYIKQVNAELKQKNDQ